MDDSLLAVELERASAPGCAARCITGDENPTLKTQDGNQYVNETTEAGAQPTRQRPQSRELTCSYDPLTLQ